MEERKRGGGIILGDAFHEWWDDAGYTAKDIDRYEIAKEAWYAGIEYHKSNQG
jgi:hypothetical protein